MKEGNQRGEGNTSDLIPGLICIPTSLVKVVPNSRKRSETTVERGAAFRHCDNLMQGVD